MCATMMVMELAQSYQLIPHDEAPAGGWSLQCMHRHPRSSSRTTSCTTMRLNPASGRQARPCCRHRTMSRKHRTMSSVEWGRTDTGLCQGASSVCSSRVKGKACPCSPALNRGLQESVASVYILRIRGSIHQVHTRCLATTESTCQRLPSVQGMLSCFGTRCKAALAWTWSTECPGSPASERGTC